MDNNTYRIDTVYTLKQPLSHIGSSESTTSYLNTIRVMNNGRPEEVFAYTGNAIRGAWRDCGAKYLLDRLQIRVPKRAFHLLFSGGSISGDQSVDVEQIKDLRKVLPFLSVFGGGVGNQILSGKYTQTFALPVCSETSGIIPDGIDGIEYAASQTSWRAMTGEIEFSRKDDSKDRLAEEYIALPPGEQTSLMGEIEPKKKTKKTTDEAPTQMRYTAEYLIPGTQLWHSLRMNGNELELGALVSAIHEWSRNPVLGGMSGKGFGIVDMDMVISIDGTDPATFITVADGTRYLGTVADDAKKTYDAHLVDLYNAALAQNRQPIVSLLEGTK